MQMFEFMDFVADEVETIFEKPPTEVRNNESRVPTQITSEVQRILSLSSDQQVLYGMRITSSAPQFPASIALEDVATETTLSGYIEVKQGAYNACLFTRDFQSASYSPDSGLKLDFTPKPGDNLEQTVHNFLAAYASAVERRA